MNIPFFHEKDTQNETVTMLIVSLNIQTLYFEKRKSEEREAKRGSKKGGFIDFCAEFGP